MISKRDEVSSYMPSPIVPGVSSDAHLIKFRWSVDHFARTEEGTLLIFGWALHDSEDIGSLSVMLRFMDGTTQQFDSVYGTERTDVSDAIGDNPRALMCGYYFFGHTPRADVVSMSLEAHLTDGSRAVLPTNCAISLADDKPQEDRGRLRAKTYAHLTRRTWRFIRSGRFRDLAEAAQRYLAGKPRVAEDGIGNIRRTIAKQHTELIIDHDLGGGANHFRQSLARDLLAGGSTVLILTFHVPTLRYGLECRTRKQTTRVAIQLGEFLAALPQFALRRIHYNNTVSFTNQLSLIEALSYVARRTAVPVSYYMHDFHCICPSHFLLDSSGQYCGVPDVRRCQSCLPEMKDGLVSLFAERDIQLWRRRWLSFLANADEIVFFSTSSKNLLLHAYPQLARHPALKLRPHDISDFPSAPVQFDLKPKLNIGVVGRINAHKGAAIVEQMAVAMDTRGMKEQITILGALDGRSKSPSVVVTGSYQRANLASLMTKHNVNMIAFTSIWPETFSFVVAEVMSLGLPIICFDLGAPAERVREYPLGRVIPFCDGATLIKAALAFRNELLEKTRTPETKAIPIVRSPGHRAAHLIMAGTAK
jgi:glycosyltransferase involved in cell wall biosynthesis